MTTWTPSRIEIEKRKLKYLAPVAQIASVINRQAVASVIENTEPIERFENLVQSFCNTGLTKKQAVLRAAQQKPQWHASYVNAINGRQDPNPVAESRDAQAVSLFWREVNYQQQTGLSKKDAISKIANEQPDLYDSFRAAI